MGAPSVFDVIKLLFNPDVSKKLILQIAYQQLSAIGLAKILSAVLGSAIVGVSSIIKIPQVKKIINPKLLTQKVSVARGLSLEGISLETMVYLVHVLYNRQSKNKFVNYGEAFLLGIQNVAIILLIEYYNLRSKLAKKDTLSEKEQIETAMKELVTPISIMVGIVVFLTKIAEPSLVEALQVLNIPLSIISKLPQIKQNYDLKSTSHLSEITVGANVLGSLIRVFTTIQSFNRLGRDYVLLAGYTSSFIVNSFVAGQCYYYKKLYKKDEEADSKKLQ
ncbi:unnamed protein product [Debaryomyces tyrocola]|nr:unnamed protein product [Debaryomyces tyrocola]